jgi:hypothetical protein
MAFYLWFAEPYRAFLVGSGSLGPDPGMDLVPKINPVPDIDPVSDIDPVPETDPVPNSDSRLEKLTY